MKLPEATILRLDDNVEQESLGYFVAFDGLNKLMECKTLELPDRNNEKSKSRIPANRYLVKPRYSKKFGNHFIVTGVPNRSYILFHVLNKYTQTRGCIGPGESYGHINSDNILDITSSRKILDMMLRLMPDGFWLNIYDQDDLSQ